MGPREKPVDWQIESWQSRNKNIAEMQIVPSVHHDLSPDQLTLVCTLTYVAVYAFEAGARQVTMARPGKKPLWARGVPYVMVEDEKSGRVFPVMAGMFPAEEGGLFNPSDTRAAPLVLLSPDFNILPYADLFEMESPYGTDRESPDTRSADGIKVGNSFQIPLPVDS